MSSLTPGESPTPDSPQWEKDLFDKGISYAEDLDITCDCDGPSCKPKVGWSGKPPVAVDGDNWPLDFAAKILGASEKDLRDLIRIVGLEPAGTMRMASYRRSGRNPRAYNASKLVKLWSEIQELARTLKGTQDPGE